MSEAEVNARALAEGPAEPTPSVFIMGAGVVGTALAARLVRAGVPVTGLHGRQVEPTDAARALPGVVVGGVGVVVRSTGEIPDILSESDAVIIAVRDDRVPEVAERLAREGRLRREQILLHASGANPARTILAAALPYVRAVGTLCTRWSRSPTRASPSRGWAKSPSGSKGTSRPARSPSGSCARSAPAR